MAQRLAHKHRYLLAAIGASVALPAAAQEDTTNWFRLPTISPNGSTIAFCYGGDIYQVSTNGGRAVPLTLHESYETRPVWSRDGRHIAFASDRNGNFDVYVMPSVGGEATRLTYHSADDFPSDFTVDNGSVIFESSRLDDVKSVIFPSGVLSELYSVSLNGGTPDMVLTTPALNSRFDSAGGRMLYEDRKGYEDPLRKHHTSSIARDVWMYDASTGAHTQLTSHANEDRNPHWSEDENSLYFLSERAGDFNVFRMPLTPDADSVQLTFFENHPVRDLAYSAESDNLIFSWHGDLYRLHNGSEPERLNITIAVDTTGDESTGKTEKSGASQFVAAASGKEMAFVLRSIGSGLVTGLAYDPNNDVLYGINRNFDTLLSINTSTGAGTTIGSLGIDTVAGGLAFDRNSNTLYYNDNTSSSMYSINTTTGAATLIGLNGIGLMQGLAFDPNSNTLYATSSPTNSLYTINTATGAATLVGPFGVSLNDHGLGFDNTTNTLYCTNFVGSPDNLYTVNTSTGALTVVGPLSTSINGFTVQQSPIPVCPDPVLLQQAPSLAASHFSDLDPTGTSFEQADDVTFAQDVIVRSLRWWGAYGNSYTPQAGVDDFLLRVYEDAGGVPAPSPIATFHLGGAIRVGTGNTMAFGSPEFVHVAELPAPLTLEAGKRYWLTLINNTTADADDNWGWNQSQIGNNLRADRTPPDTGTWGARSTDRALELCGVPCTLDCPTDIDGNGVVNGADLAALLATWGVCPAPARLVVPNEPRRDMLMNTRDIDTSSLLGN